jgi:hypothetical protein
MIENLFNCCIIDEDERKDLLQLAEESTDLANPFQSQVCRSSGTGAGHLEEAGVLILDG